MANSIPQPPDHLIKRFDIDFLPSEDLHEWVGNMFIKPSSELFNEDHTHLISASIGFLWTTCKNVTKGRRVLGMAEIFNARSNKWVKGRQEQQLRSWFTGIPDFIITIDAHFWRTASNPERFALIEHELYHCGQAHDEFGAPRFSNETGKPIFTIRAHDVEEFVGVVQRYGAEATGIKDIVDAANKGPSIAPAKIDGLCGTCQNKVA